MFALFYTQRNASGKCVHVATAFAKKFDESLLRLSQKSAERAWWPLSMRLRNVFCGVRKSIPGKTYVKKGKICPAFLNVQWS